MGQESPGKELPHESVYGPHCGGYAMHDCTCTQDPFWQLEPPGQEPPPNELPHESVYGPHSGT